MDRNTLSFARSCQSPKTGFVHLFDGQPSWDAIPVYENFCFALLLFRQKTMEGVQEGKKLLARLYAFQSPTGNFPLYIHDFPRCYSPILPLRIAPLLKQLMATFSHVLDEEFKKQTLQVIDRMLECAKNRRMEKNYSPLWERRYLALQGFKTEMCSHETSDDWAEELITEQILQDSLEPVTRLIHPLLGIYAGPASKEAQENSQPRLTLLDAWAHPGKIGPQHPLHLSLAALIPTTINSTFWSGSVGNWEIRQTERYALSFAPQCSNDLALRLMWLGNHIHSLVIPTINAHLTLSENQKTMHIDFDLPELTDILDNDFFEIELFCDISDETKIFIEGKKASTFYLGEMVKIETPELSLHFSFQIEAGDGDFCGHISRGNRPFQTAKSDLAAYDWRIGLRTLRRSKTARISLTLHLCG